MRRLLTSLLALTGFLALAAPASAAWEWPVSGDVITPYRNGSDPYATGQHRGIDIAAPAGAAVVAAAAGEVRFAGTAGSSGLTVSIRTGDDYDTSYLHLSSLAVRAGARVGAGDRIGAVGTTGTRSAAPPHLHFGVRDAGTRHAYHDPLNFLPPPAAPPRAPEAPAPATAPEPAPAPPAAAPAPAPARTPGPARGRAPARAPAPAGRPAPARGRTPASAGDPARTRAPAPGRGRAPAASPLPASPGGRAPAGRRLPVPAEGHAYSPSGEPSVPGAPHGASAPAAAHGRTLDGARAAPFTTSLGAKAPKATRSNGPDIGWALACAGLLLAAGILGLTEGGRRSTGRGRARLLGALRHHAHARLR